MTWVASRVVLKQLQDQLGLRVWNKGVAPTLRYCPWLEQNYFLSCMHLASWVLLSALYSLFLEPQVVYLAIYHSLLFFMFVCLGTSKCLSVEIFDKCVNTSIFIDIFSCIFDVPMPPLISFYVNYVSGYFKSTPSSEKWFEVLQESFWSHLKTFEHLTDCRVLTHS